MACANVGGVNPCVCVCVVYVCACVHVCVCVHVIHFCLYLAFEGSMLSYFASAYVCAIQSASQGKSNVTVFICAVKVSLLVSHSISTN